MPNITIAKKFDKTSFARGYHTIGEICNVIDAHFNSTFNADIKKLVYHAHKLGYVKVTKPNETTPGLGCRVMISGACVLAILGLMPRTRKARVPAEAWHVWIG